MNNHQDTSVLSDSRSNIVSKIKVPDIFDVLVIGGGVHGAALARQASASGFSTVLLERDDYAGATSSRSSKMAHGGLRYLEMLDFQQVLEGIRAREELFEIADHLVKPEPFLIPVPKGKHFFRFKLDLGLYIYDLMVKGRDRKHRWIKRKNLSFDGYDSSRTDLEGCFQYFDGLLDDSRLVLEYILSAREHGALCLNYAEVQGSSFSSGVNAVDFKDVLSQESCTVKARIVINCAGPWAPQLSNGAFSYDGVKYSRGTHLLFDQPWKGPSLFLPMEGKARYYFVWPHPAGTMVGTTEREVDKPSRDPQPTHDEIQEVLDRLQKDLPRSGLNGSSLHYAFAGERTLPLRSGAKHSSKLSRKHIWKLHKGVLTLLGGKLTTANWTATEGLKEIRQTLGRSGDLTLGEDRRLPGAGLSRTLRGDFLNIGLSKGFSSKTLERVLTRYGRRVVLFLEDNRSFENLGNGFLRGELNLALEQEQAETIEDVMRRRIGMEFFSGHGLSALDEVTRALCDYHSSGHYQSQRADYINRMSKIDQLLGKNSCTDIGDSQYDNVA